MTENISCKWVDVWRRKGELGYKENCHSLQGLMALDGFDGVASMPVESWEDLGEVITEALEIRKEDKVLEVGCGAGAMLYVIQDKATVLGLDYSLPLLRIAHRVLKPTELVAGEARVLPFKSDTFSAVFSNSVFHYFPNYEYAKQVISEMIRVSKNRGRIFITDIPDIAVKEKVEEYRWGLNLNSSKRPGLKHLYYPQSFFRQIATGAGFNIRISIQDVKGYQSSGVRFNVLFY